MPSTAFSSFLYDGVKCGLGVCNLISAQAVNTCHWSSTQAGASYYWTLISNSYIPNETHVFASAWSGHECSGASFTAGFNGTIRKAVASRVLNINTVSHQAEFQANSVTWTAVGATQGTAHAFGIVMQVVSDGNSPIVTYNSLAGFPITFNGTDLTLAPTSAGILAGVDFVSVT